MKNNKTSKTKLRKPAKGIQKSKREMPKIPKSKVQNQKFEVRSPKSAIRISQSGAPKAASHNRKSAVPKSKFLNREPKNPQLAALRKEAEEILKSKKGVPDKIGSMDFPELLHEFLVYQAELEIQNEELRVSQRQLEESQSKYADLFDFAPIGYFSFDKDGTILEVNLTGAQLLGIERRRLMKKSFPLLIASSYKTVFFSHLKKVFKSRTKQTCELKLIKKDSSQFYAHLESIAVSDNDGNYSCRTAVSDITESKEAENKIRHYASFPELNPNPILEVDLRGKITFSNPGAVRIQKELNLQDTSVFLPGDMANILNVLGQGKEASFHREVKIKDRIFGETLQLVPQFNCLRIFANNITEKKLNEEALRKSEEYFRLLMENASDGVTILEMDGTIRYESRSVERMLGYKPEELVGTSAFDLIHPDDLSDVTTIFSYGAGNPGIVLSAQFRCRHKDGSWRFLDVMGKNLLDNSAIQGIVVNSRDITESMQAEEEVRSERQRLINILDSMVDGVYIVNQKNEIEYVNPLLEEEYGPVNGRKCHDYFEGRKKACTWCKNQEVFKGKTVRSEWYSEKTNKTYDLINTPLKNTDGSISKLGIFRDITDRKQAEEALKKVNRTLKALSKSNQAMLYAKTESDFLKDVCTIVVEDCGHAMVWIGFAEDNESKTVRPVASAGFEKGYLETLNITWADTERGRGPTGTAIRTGRPSICRNMLTDPAFEPWRDEAIKRGYASSIVLPLMADSKAFGAINIYSREPDPFAEDELKLLSELAGDLSYGILAMRSRVAHAEAEEAVRKSEARLIRSQEVAHLGSWELDVINNRLTWSDEVYRIFGLQPQEFDATYDAFLEAVHPEDRAAVNAAYSDSIREGRRTYEIEHRIVRRWNGEIRVVHEKCDHFRDSSGRVIRSVGMVLDITERKRMEEELRRSRDELEIKVLERTGELQKAYTEIEAFFESSLTPFVFLDREFNFIRVNEAYAKCCARDVSEFEGHNHFEFYPHEENEAIFRQVVETKTPYQAFAKAFAFPDHPEWGTTYWDWTLTPILDSSGEVDFLVFALSDVTERKQAENELREHERLLTTVLENLPVGVWTLDREGNIVQGNPSAWQIWGGAKYVGINGFGQYKGWWLDTGKPIEPNEWGAARAIQKGETSLNEEIEIECFDGTRKIILHSAIPLFDDKRTITGAVVVNQDITERKEALVRLSVTSRLLEFFVTATGRKEYLNSVVDLLHDWTGCNCIGVRILDKQGNIPYESYTGFSRDFWEAENWISVKDHQCACTPVVLQKPDPQEMSMMTPNGSFYCNETAEFERSLTEQELSRYRGMCILTGYKSIAIVPIRYRDHVIGAVHIADKRGEMVPVEKVEFIESLTLLIGEAMSRFSAEEALGKSEARLSEAERIGLLGNWEWDIGNDIVSLSDQLYRIFGLKREEFYPSYESFLNLIHPDDLTNVQDSIRKAVRERKPFDMDFRFKRNDGVVRVMHGRGEITYDLSGRPLLVRGTGQDITDRMKAEKALRDSEERYRMLIETMNEGLGMDDENGLLVYANDRLCEMLGYSLNEIIGHPVLSFFDKKNQKILQEQVEKRKSGENDSYRLEWIKKDGQKIITLVSPRGIFNSAGKYKGSFAVITDITERLRLESIAEAVNTMDNIGFIFSGVRHEIGNPVNSIKMALSVLKQNLDSYSKEMIKEYADRMLSEIVRIEYLLKAMKSFNMFETMELIDVNMTTFMDNFLRLISDDFAKKGIRIETNIPETLWAYIDPRAFQQVLLNVMTNASDALEGKENATVTIRVSKLGNMINIMVEDNGSGMSENQVEDLFKPFYTTKENGTGLGLVISKKMMTKMKGLVEVVSEKDKGTIVDLFVPEGINEEE